MFVRSLPVAARRVGACEHAAEMRGGDDGWIDKALAMLVADESPLAADELRHRVVLCPSFHPLALISARLGAAPSLRLAARVAPWSPDDPPVLVEAAAPLSAAQADRLRDELEACVPDLDAPDDRRGVDGITIAFEVGRGDAAPRRVVAWSPEPGQSRHRHVLALHRLAGEVLVDPEARQVLDQLHGYLDAGLPVRDLGGAPRELQIFGRLSSSQQGALAAFLGHVDPAQAVLVDMRNFEGMGTLLHPLFRRFSRRPGPLVWVVSPAARHHLHDARVPTGQMFADVEQARRSLAAAV